MIPKFELLKDDMENRLSDFKKYNADCRKKFFKNILIAILVCAALWFAATSIISDKSQNTQILIFGGAVVIFVICFIIIYSIQASKVSTQYKNTIIHKLIKSITNDAEYFPDKHIPQNYFSAAQLYKYDRFGGEDLVTGKIDKTPFWFSEVKAEKKTTDAKGRTHWNTVFKGIVFVADFHKDFRGVTILSNNLFLAFFSRYKKMKMEDVNFNKTFKTYTTDEVEARYILSPLLIERFLNIKKTFDKNIEVSFTNSRVTIFLHTNKNNFEASLFSTIKMARVQNDFNLLYNLIGIVEELNLNTRIWTKE